MAKLRLQKPLNPENKIQKFQATFDHAERFLLKKYFFNLVLIYTNIDTTGAIA